CASCDDSAGRPRGGETDIEPVAASGLAAGSIAADVERKIRSGAYRTNSPGMMTRSLRGRLLSPRTRTSLTVMRKPVRRLQWRQRRRHADGAGAAAGLRKENAFRCSAV